MDFFNFAENLVNLRHQKGVTQEALADFVGVTKASVSKWETKQSLPDVLLLPQLAAYFGVSVDALLGYEPQLSREQIRKLYRELAADFAARPFEEVMEKSRGLAHKYYACHRFLFLLCVLWLNHSMLAGPDHQAEILEETARLCTHIIENCKDMGICNDAVIMKASVDLQLGRYTEVIEVMEEIRNPYRISNSGDALLIAAYEQSGQHEKAHQYTQFGMFLHLILLVSDAVQYLMLHLGDEAICEETMARIDGLMEIFHLESLHGNVAAQFHYAAALSCCVRQKPGEALARLRRFTDIACGLLDGPMELHGDDFFCSLDGMIEQLDLGADAVRSKKLVAGSARQALENPAFAMLAGEKEFKTMMKMFSDREEKL